MVFYDFKNPKKIKKKFSSQNGPIRRENRCRKFFGKKSFFLGTWSFFGSVVGQKNVRNFFFIFRLTMAQFVQKIGLEIILRLFVKKPETLTGNISGNMHPNIFWTLALFLELNSESTLQKLAVPHV